MKPARTLCIPLTAKPTTDNALPDVFGTAATGRRLAFSLRELSRRSAFVSPDSQRILIVTNGHDASLLSLYDYFTFRGYRVDCADRMDDARALVRHVFYHAVIVAVTPPLTTDFSAFLEDVRSRHVGTRIVAVCNDEHRNEMEGVDVDGIVPHGLPIAQLARLIRHAIAHSTPSA